MRIHITGASGSGTTTLGRAVAAATGAPFVDADDFYWLAARRCPVLALHGDQSVADRLTAVIAASAKLTAHPLS